MITSNNIYRFFKVLKDDTKGHTVTSFSIFTYGLRQLSVLKQRLEFQGSPCIFLFAFHIPVKAREPSK